METKTDEIVAVLVQECNTCKNEFVQEGVWPLRTDSGLPRDVRCPNCLQAAIYF